jgi:hypothetical protein
MRFKFEAHLMKFMPVTAFWRLLGAPTGLFTRTSALG